MPWDPVVESSIVAIHAALVPGSPTGQIVYFEGFFGQEAGRSFLTVWVANPGLDEITRTAQTSIDVKPSDVPTEQLLNAPPSVVSSSLAHRLRADELVFSRNNLPVGSKVELYLPDVDIDEVIGLSARRNGPPTLERVDAHTVRFELGEASYVALPGGRELNIAGLVSVTLPPGGRCAGWVPST